MSLATKCQLLFGVAAGIIILAALLVTWQRIEQLTRQQDLVAGETLAKQLLAEHAQTGVIRPDQSGFDFYDGVRVRRPRLLRATDSDQLTPFEERALNSFQDRPTRLFYTRFVQLDDNPESQAWGLRLALAARAVPRCMECHAGDAARPRQWVTTRPAAGPVTAPPRVLGPPWLAPQVPAEPPDLLPETTGEATEAETVLDEVPPLLGLVSVELPSQVSARQRLLNRVFLITAALAAAVTATLTLYFILTRLILTPVRILQETAEKVRGGDLNVRAEIPSGDEFETLGQTLNGMVASLQQRNEQLAKANRSLDKRLGDLAEANVALDESNRLKGEFLANVSHELRTPLNSILGFADLVKTSAKENPKVERYAGNIARSGQALLELINDLLDLAKIEAGRMEVRSGEFSIKDLFEALATLLAPLALRQQVKIVTEVGPGVPILQSDAGKLQQILYNLLSNAIKFSPVGGRIDVVARRELRGGGDEPVPVLRLTVTDQGPGIAPEHHERIFEKFRQLDAGVTREHTGTGLGLSISRELAHLLGGELGVESKPGEGATFWLNLPLRRLAEKSVEKPAKTTAS